MTAQHAVYNGTREGICAPWSVFCQDKNLLQIEDISNVRGFSLARSAGLLLGLGKDLHCMRWLLAKVENTPVPNLQAPLKVRCVVGFLVWGFGFFVLFCNLLNVQTSQ